LPSRGPVAHFERYASGEVNLVKRIVPAIIILIALAVVALTSFKPFMGEKVETWETTNQTFRVRIDRHAERFMVPVAGAYYVFQSAPSGSNSWRDIMTFRHDDPVPIPREQVRFVSDRVGYLFMGWMYAVTTDGGANWVVWDAGKDLPNWGCCNYGLIRDVRLELDGTGVMILNPIPERRGEAPELRTKDYGRHWSL
jgi:hypothetical protein